MGKGFDGLFSKEDIQMETNAWKDVNNLSL